MLVIIIVHVTSKIKINLVFINNVYCDHPTRDYHNTRYYQYTLLLVLQNLAVFACYATQSISYTGLRLNLMFVSDEQDEQDSAPDDEESGSDKESDSEEESNEESGQEDPSFRPDADRLSTGDSSSHIAARLRRMRGKIISLKAIRVPI